VSDSLAALPDARDLGAGGHGMVRLCPVAFFAQQRLLALMACNLVTTSLSTATNALALFGLILNSAGMWSLTAQLAIKLLDGRIEAATLVFFVCPWIVCDPSWRRRALSSISEDVRVRSYAVVHGLRRRSGIADDALWQQISRSTRTFEQLLKALLDDERFSEAAALAAADDRRAREHLCASCGDGDGALLLRAPP
jgi:hypothetical protein